MKIIKTIFLSQVESGANILAKDDDGRSALQLVENILEDDPDDILTDQRLAIKTYLAEVNKNPPKPRKIVKKMEQEELFTTGSNSSFSYQKGLEPVATSTQRSQTVGKENMSSHKARHLRASDSAVHSRKQVDKLTLKFTLAPIL